MNIAIDIRCLMEGQLTGVGEYTYNLLNNLFQKDNHNQYYLFYNSSKNVTSNVQKFNFPNVHYVGFKFPNKLLNFSLKLFKYPKLDKLIEKKYKVKIDFFFFPNISFLQTECPYLITVHDLSFELFPEFLSWKRKLWHKIINPKKLYKKAEHIISVSYNTTTDLINLYKISSKKITTIHSGINSTYKKLQTDNPKLKKIKKKYHLPQKFFLFLGTLEPRKNINSLISAFELFQKQNKNYSLVIAGKAGWKCKKTLQKIKQNSQIKYVNFIPTKHKRYFYNLATAFVYPSHYEGFGFPPLEAMACECPVITSNNSSLSEVCNDSAILIDSHDIDDLTNAMLKIEKTDLTEIGYFQSKNFNWQKTAEQFLEALDPALREERG